MFFKGRLFIVILVLFSVLTGCGEYQRVQKSTDLEYKTAKAIEYYEKGKYASALVLFDELMTLYRGTVKVQEIYHYYSMTQFHMRDYLLAAYHFKTFYQTFPNNPKADEAAFMVGFCYYKESPPYSLDQASTMKAINELQLYVNTHPNSQHLEECNMLIGEMREKLQKKSFEIARQYWKTEHYKAAVEAFSISMSEFPDTPYREESMYLRLDSSYKLAKNSIVDLQLQRFKETQTAYFDFIDRYPESQYRKFADKIYKDCQENMQQLAN